ncbi:MAG: PIN domain-containing protein [Acidobacteriota bacterium]
MAAHLQNYSVSFCDEDLCQISADAREAAERNGKPIDVADAWIAATAIYHGAPLLTNNPRHFAGVDGLEILTRP